MRLFVLKDTTFALWKLTYTCFKIQVVFVFFVELKKCLAIHFNYTQK